MQGKEIKKACPEPPGVATWERFLSQSGAPTHLKQQGRSPKPFPNPECCSLLLLFAGPSPFPLDLLAGSGHIPLPAGSLPGFLPDLSHLQAVLLGYLALAKGFFHPGGWKS